MNLKYYLYLNYLILSNGYRTIFLGQSIQTSSLDTLFTYNSTFNFVTYLTVEPNKDEIMPYLNEFHEKLLSKTDSKLIIFGPQQLEIKTDNLPDKIELYRSVESFMSNYFIQTILS